MKMRDLHPPTATLAPRLVGEFPAQDTRLVDVSANELLGVILERILIKRGLGSVKRTVRLGDMRERADRDAMQCATN
jgi:hypothetical protein